ncbi:hypothetical protein [Lignipirellula cremea]|uniref:Uncharacterized protein n=1 Tax=Lignipirellula cremea TaxID=2528010 RepID=A0A518E557_9BACT|nr:hypothetical protein [Lignipirellula cremea]QDU99232.1 hypothetical protein Pla8534_71450 [Lignipirellula cremea]
MRSACSFLLRAHRGIGRNLRHAAGADAAGASSACLALLFWLVIGAATPAVCQAPGGPISQFRRVYVVEEEGSNQNMEAVGMSRRPMVFTPLRLEVFEQLLSTAKGSADAPAALRASIASAVYTARLDDKNQLVEGEARLQVVKYGEEAASISIDGCRLAISSAAWETPDSQPSMPALIGLASDGSRFLEAPAPGTLLLTWSLSSQQSAAGEMIFPLHLPDCANNELVLELPLGMTPSVDFGVVQQVEAEPPTDLPASNDPADPTGEPAADPTGEPAADPAASEETTDESAGPPTQKWRILLGGRIHSELRIARAPSPAQASSAVLVRRRLNYDLSERGASLVAELRIDSAERGLKELVVQADPTLRLISAQMGETDLPITVMETPRQYLISFPEPLYGLDRVVRLNGVAPLPQGEPWRLPAFEIRDAQRLEGTILVQVRDPLIVDFVQTDGVQQSAAASVGGADSGERLRFQCVRPDGALTLLLRKREIPLKCDCATAIRLGPATIVGRHTAELSTPEGEVFELEAYLPQSWIIDAIDTQPAEALEEWSIPSRGSQRQLLRMKLDRAITPERPLRLVVRAHQRTPAPGETISLEQLRMADFRGVNETRRLLALGAEPPHQLEVSGDADVQWLDETQLNASEREALQLRRGALLLLDDDGARALSVSLRSEGVRFSAQLQARAIADGPLLRMSYTMGVIPEASQLDRVQVRFSQASEEPLRWTLEGRPVAAVRLETNVAGGDMLDDGETWEITLPESLDRPFELTAERSSPLGTGRLLSLPSLPEAATQAGTIRIGSLGDQNIQIRHPQLRSAPSLDRGGDASTPIRAVLVYQPSQNISVLVEPTRPFQDAVWAWSCDLVTRCGATQTACSAVYRLENWGAATFSFRPPAGAASLTVLLGDREIDPVNADGLYSVTLPPGRRFPLVEVRYLIEEPGLGGAVRAFAPETTTAVLSSRWTAWLPPGFQAVPRHDSRSPLRRLLGRLQRTDGERPFRLFQTSDWEKLIGQEEQQTAAAASLSTFLIQLGEFDESRFAKTADDLSWAPVFSPRTWRDFFEMYQRPRSTTSGTNGSQQQAPPLPTIWIDRHALAACEMSPTSLLPAGEEPSRSLAAPGAGNRQIQRGASVLAAANLALLAGSDGLLLTSQKEAARLREQWRPSLRPHLGVIRLDRQGELAAGLAIQTPYLSTSQWLRNDAGPENPWRQSPEAAFAANRFAGWSAHQSSGVDLSRAVLRIYQPAQVEALAWSAMLLTAALAAWLLRRRPLWRIVVCVGFGALALSAPAPYVAIASGSFLGILFGCALGWVWSLTRAARDPLDPGDTVIGHPIAPQLAGTTVSRVLLGLLVLALWWVGIGSVNLAQEPSNAKGRPVYEVFIPVDKDRKPTGMIQVPQPLEEELLRVARGSKAATRDWVIERVVYHCQLDRQGIGGKVGIAQLSAEYSLVIHQPTQVELPFEKVYLLEGEPVLLDNSPIEHGADNGTFTFNAPTPGAYLLRMEFRPREFFHGDDFTSFEIPAVPAPQAQLLVTLPGNVAATSPTALGATTVDPETSRLMINLGPVDRVSLRWPTQGGDFSSAPRQTVDQSIWVKYRPNSVIYETHCTWQIPPGRVLTRVGMTVDPRLKLLKLSPDQPVARTTSVLDPVTGMQQIELELNREFEQELNLQIGFLAIDGSGVGLTQFYRIDPVDSDLRRRWVGVSTAPNLNFELQTDAPLEAVTAAEFLSDWGPATEQPLAAYRLPPGNVGWRATLTPHPTSIVAERCEEWVSLDHPAARLFFEADLKIEQGEVFQHRLATAGVQVERISVQRDGKEVAHRWSHDGQGVTTIFLNEPLSGRYRLQLEGAIPMPTNTEQPRGRRQVAVPLLNLAGVRSASDCRLHIYRRQTIEVLSAGAENLEVETIGEPGDFDPTWGRLVGEWTAADAVGEDWIAASATPLGVANLRVSLNLPQTVCQQLTTLRREDARWTAEVDCRLNVLRDSLDVIRFDAPPEWDGPFTVDIPATVEVTTIPGRVRRRITVRPERPLTGMHQLKIRGKVRPLPGERVAAPDIVPLDLGRVERFLALPRRVQSQQYNWETSGLIEDTLPAPFTEPVEPASEASTEAASDVEYTAWRVISDRVKAAIDDVEQGSGEPLVRLADVYVTARQDGSYVGLAAFDLEPASLTACEMELPIGTHLVHVSTAGLPALLSGESTTGSRYRIRLATDHLPQRIVVLYTGDDSRQGDAFGYSSPTLVDIPVDRTLWTVFGPGDAGAGVEIGEGSGVAVDLVRQEQYRWQALSTLLERADNVLLESEQVQAESWRQPWLARSVDIQERLQQIEDSAANQLLDAAVDGRKKATQSPLHARERLWMPLEVWRSLDPFSRPVRSTFAGAMPKISVAYPALDQGYWRPLFWIALLILAVSLVEWLISRTWLYELVLQWPHALGVVAGIAWWLLLSPSVVGLAIVGLSLVLAFASPWRGLRPPSPGV